MVNYSSQTPKWVRLAKPVWASVQYVQCVKMDSIAVAGLYQPHVNVKK